MASFSKVMALAILFLAITVESRQPNLSKKDDDGSDYYGYDYYDYSSMPPEPEKTEKFFKKKCSENIPKDCEEAIIDKIFKDHSAPIADDRCCRKLVSMGFRCYLSLAFAADELPKPPVLNDTQIVERASRIFDKCVLNSKF